MHKITLRKLIKCKLISFTFLFLLIIPARATVSFNKSYKVSGSSSSSKAFAVQNKKTGYGNQSCDGENQIIIKDDFGSGESNWGPQPSLSDFYTTYRFTQTSDIAPGEYSILKNPIIGHPLWWNSDRDHTAENNENGYMLIFNANSIPGTVFYEKKYSKLCSGSFCTFTIYASNIFTPTYQDYSVKPKVKIELVNPSDGKILQSLLSDELEIGKTNELLWKEITMSFTISEGMSDVLVRVINAQSDPNAFGNDLALDDASFSICIPEATLSISDEVRIGESTMISAINHNTTAIEYDYQWQQWDGNEWKDILGATSLQYKTPILNQDTLYRIRYAQKGIDIANNNNLICSGSKKVNFQLLSPQYSSCLVNTINADFEYPVVSTSAKNINQNYNPSQLGWKTTAPDGMIEFWKSGDMGHNAYSGNQFIELNANYSSGLYQDYDTSIATYFNYSFAHKGREGYDTMVLKAGPPGGPYTTITTATTGMNQWQLYKGTYTVPSGQTTTRFIFESLLTATNDPTTGNFLDAINFTATINPPSIDGNFNPTTGSYEKTICANNSTIFKASENPGSIVYWYDATGTVLLYEGIRFTTPNLTQNTKYKVKQKNSFNCESDFLNIEVLVMPKPADIIKNIEICSGQTYTWPANGITYSTSQTGLKIINDGCTADQVLNLTVRPKLVTTGATICKGGTGILTVNSSSKKIATSSFTGHWNSETDPKAQTTGEKNSTTCRFKANAISNYTATNFTVSMSGIYTFKMKDTDEYDGCAYIYTGDFTPGTCSGGGKWIVGDDDNDGSYKEPRMTAYFEAGVIYTLISTLWTRQESSLIFNGDYTWNVITPSGGEFLLDTLNYWYTSPTGGNPIGWGDSFNPVGVLGSGLQNTNTAGTTTYYVSDGVTNCERTPVDFTIRENNRTTQPAVGVCLNHEFKKGSLTNEVNGEGVTGIGTPINLPQGLTASWENNTVFITGKVIEEGDFWYTIPLIGSCGEETAIGEILVKPKPADIVTEKEICYGQTFKWTVNDITYSESTELRIKNDECTADQVLKLTVKDKPTNVITNETRCSGETFHWDVTGLDYNTTGTYTKNNDGCTADQILNLTITPKPDDIITTVKICPGETYKWEANNTTYSTNQNALRISKTCEADQVLNLIIKEDVIFIMNRATICEGDNYYWEANGQTYTTSQYYLNYTDRNCEVITTLLLEVKPKPADVVINKTICSGETFHWDVTGLDYAASGTYKQNNYGCMADQILNLNVMPKPADIATEKEICYGETFKWTVNDITYSQSTELRIKNDCAADQVLKLTVKDKPADIAIIIEICSGQSYHWDATGLDYTTAGIYFKNNDGCTADQYLKLIVNPKPSDIETNETICSGETFHWNVTGLDYTTSGTYTKNNDGCTADQVLNLTVKESLIINPFTVGVCFGEYLINMTVCELISGKVTDIGAPIGLPSGLSLFWSAFDNTIRLNGSSTQVGEFSCSVPLITDDCGDNIAIIIVNISPDPKLHDIITNKTICSGKTYTWPANGVTYSTSQIGLKIINDICTADDVLNLTVTPKPADVVTTESICSGTIFHWDVTGMDYSSSGTYTKTNDECTANQILNLTITPKPDPIIIYTTICEGDTSISYIVHNDGCTADIYYKDKILPKPADIVTEKEICYGQSFKWAANDIIYSESTELRIENDNCTADQVLKLTVKDKPANVITFQEICYGEIFHWDVTELDYNTSGTFDKYNDGCTGDQILKLIVKDKPADIITNETKCSGETFHWNVTGLEYNTTGKYTKNNDGCTADQVLNLTITPKPADIVKTIEVCPGMSHADIEKDIKDGCTADIVYNFVYVPKSDDIVTEKEICYGETFKWTVNEITYSESTEIRIENEGCTADQVLRLKVKDKPADIITTESICSGKTYTWPVNGITYSTSQTGLKITNDGCTADQVLNLTVTPKPADVITTESICSGKTYTWPVNGIPYSTSQTGLKITNDGCTADQILNLTVGSKPEDIITTESICSGETFHWNVTGLEYNATGTYTKNNDGCTADQVLKLTITPKPADIITNETRCSGETFHWNQTGLDYNTTGTYTKNNDECTADQILNLTITPKPADIAIVIEICSGQSYSWDATGQNYSTEGIYFKNNDGCTADQFLKLIVKPKPADIITEKEICYGQTFKWTVNEITYSQSTELRIENDKCTADQVLKLTVKDKPADIITNETRCSGEIFHWNVTGLDYNTTGTYTKNNDRCTADQVLKLTITPKPDPIIIYTYVCEGDSYSSDIIQNDGCTADIHYKNIFVPKPADIITEQEICYGQSFKWAANDIIYSESTELRIENDKCTADQVLKLTVKDKPADIITNETRCFGETFHWDVTGLDYNATGTYTKNNDGCTADQILNLTITPKPADIIKTIEVCEGDSFPSTDRDIKDGCTADIVYRFIEIPKPADIITEKEICYGQTFKWTANEITYSESTELRIENDNCTADQILKLTVKDKPVDVITNETRCSGETFHWNVTGLDYNTSGTYTKNNDGCTADQVLNLTITPKPADIITTESVCFGRTYTWPASGITYSTSQDGLKIVNDGCTADQILNLIITPKPAAIVTNETICSGAVYFWSATGLDYNTSGTYTKNNDGCTSDQVLKLTVNNKPADIVTTKTICSGEAYFWPANRISYTTSTTLKIENDGCTADEILNLNFSTPLSSELISNTLLRETCNGEQDGAFSIQIKGGTVPYKVALNNKDGVYQSLIDSDYTFSNLAGGRYTVYIKDALNCTTELEVTVEGGIAMNPIANINYTCEDNSPTNYVTINLPQSNTNFNDIDYSLDGGLFQSDNVFKNLSFGSHTVTARHLSGCLENTIPFVIDLIQPLNLSLTNTELNEITASGENGSGNYQYSFEGESFSTNNKFIIYKSGIYNITVRDGSGCTFSTSQYFDYIDLCIPNYFTPNGDGIADYWGPDCTSSYKKLTYTIFDRYGRELANYHFGQKWDGKYKGQELTSGDYWYVLKLNDPKDNREFVGHFTLYR